MPWCEECARYYTPNSVEESGACPTCGDLLQLPADHDHRGESDTTTPADDEAAPWHFKLMVVAVVSYLGWRFLQLFV